ncbi:MULTISPECIES: carboxypeptidase-like regulatory domain-containing protein [unclassified Imperialibacter]|uniref:carboxypeptidase-like regulatory domain-containing protein n=1 Tax=unclassified Imperialibacter TaxID=2629706 RepID=UPI001254FC64|nr:MULTISPECIES: carboxypeptidase-like regulatory domain-containing protein [unclassified Imperialibacter]CAD5259417.1 hypothetical protein IMPERIA75_240011 [Imperialibacter sp. 75]CAD5297635.1 hypothetical protein IMPERIA89_720011 [Imperialibacter sp. 89]VVT02398.1 hypothetical protein IMPR6_120059 [Imperialibacter sp. EC-SDR9]
MQLISALLSKRILFVLFFLACSLAVLGQTGSLSGRVVDASTEEPLPFANVFISSTTLGSTTALDGSFLIERVPFGAVRLVVSYVGYQNQTFNFDFTESSNLSVPIALEPALEELAAVEVASKKDKKWERKLSKFTKVFLGDTEFSKRCRILNPWVLEFAEDKDKGLVATASQPVEIENQALGYKVFYHLRLFNANSTYFFFTGETRFEEMTPADEQQKSQWIKNRVIAFKGSTRHLFLAILYEYIQKGQLQQEGFALHQEKFPREGPIVRHPDLEKTKKEILIDYPMENLMGASYRTGLYRILLNGKVEVHYKRELGVPKNTIYNDTLAEVSWLEVKEGYIDVTKTGLNQKPDQLLVSGAMSQGWVAMMLPNDYDPASNNP